MNFDYIAKNLAAIQAALPAPVKLVAVSKTHPTEALQSAYDAGQRHFGENKVQELVAKYEALPKDIQWHFIGHVQTNKLKYIVPFVHLIHGVDREKVLHELQKEAAKINRVVEVLLQVHIAQEDSKFGFDAQELRALLAKGPLAYSHVRVVGLMGMATFTDNSDQIRQEFTHLHQLFLETQNAWGPAVQTLSMGMTGDYPIAIACGSNMVRIGTKIFGTR